MGLVISRANSIHFAVQNSDLPNIENTLSYEEKYAAWSVKGYCQRWKTTDTVTVQCVSDTATVPTVNVYEPNLGTPIVAALVESYAAGGGLDARYYFEFDVDFSVYSSRIYLEVEQDGVTWKSEYQKAENLDDELADGYLYRIEYTNQASPSALPNVQIDYTTGIDFFLYVEMSLKTKSYQKEDTIFTNVEEKKLIESNLYKARQLKTGVLPEFMLDKLAIASSHFLFTINDLRYVADGSPEVGEGGSNVEPLEFTIIHNEVLGFSTDDKGLTADSMSDFIKIKHSDTISGTWSFVVPAGYVIHFAACGHGSGSAGSYVPKFGTTPGGQELWPPYTTVALATIENLSFHVQETWDSGSDTTVYVTLTGAGAVGKIYVQLLQNFES